MNVLITGASGRIGAHLVEEALSRGWNVRLLQRGVGALSAAQPKQVEVLSGSVTDPAVARRAVEGVDAVCHLAALMPPASNSDLFETNVSGTLSLLEAIRELNESPRFIFASTDATYGTGFSDRAYPYPISESVPARPTNFYGTTKVMAEVLIEHYCRIHNLEYLILRYCWVFHAAEVIDLFSVAMWDEFLTDTQRGELAGIPDAVPVLFDQDGEPFTDHIIDARDAARATALAVERENVNHRVINICGPGAFRYSDVAPRVARALERPLADVRLDNFRPYVIDGERGERLLSFKPMFDIHAMLSEALGDPE